MDFDIKKNVVLPLTRLFLKRECRLPLTEHKLGRSPLGTRICGLERLRNGVCGVLSLLNSTIKGMRHSSLKNRKPPVWVAILYNLAPCYLPAVAVLSPLLGLTSVFGM